MARNADPRMQTNLVVLAMGACVLLSTSSPVSSEACPAGCGIGQQQNFQFGDTYVAQEKNTKLTAQACVDFCNTFADGMYWLWDYQSSDKTCSCYSSCQLPVNPNPPYLQQSGVTAMCTVPFTTGCPLAVGTCFDKSNGNFGRPRNTPDHVAHFQGLAGISFCTSKCGSIGAPFYQFATSQNPLGPIGYGDCNCYSSCFNDFVKYALQTFFIGQTCSCLFACSPPAVITSLATSCRVKGPCKVNGIQGYEYSCSLCNKEGLPAYNVKLDGCQNTLLEPGQCFTPGCTVLGTVFPGQCKTFSFKATTLPAFQVLDNPFENSTLTVLPAFAGSVVSLDSCRRSNTFASTQGGTTSRTIFEYSCKILNSGARTVNNI